MSRHSSVVQDAMCFWTPLAGREIGEQEARELLGNVAGFFGVLSRWSANEPGGRRATDEGVSILSQLRRNPR
jgi:hypothetical protein